MRNLNGLSQVISVDRWETQYRPVLEGMYIGESPVNYLRRIIQKNVAVTEPVLAAKLDSSLTKVLTAQWVDVGNMTSNTDLGKIKGNYRSAMWDLVDIIAVNSQIIRDQQLVTIHFNKNLFNRMENFDIALLLMQEAVFVAGSELDQRDSYNVRKKVANLLQNKSSLNMEKEAKDLRKLKKLIFRQTLDQPEGL